MNLSESGRNCPRPPTSMADYGIISSDKHVINPPDLWTSRIEPKYCDRCPRIVAADGVEVWVCRGQPGDSPVQGTVSGGTGLMTGILEITRALR